MQQQIQPLMCLRVPLSYRRMFKLALDKLPLISPLVSWSNKTMTFTFENRLKTLVDLT